MSDAGGYAKGRAKRAEIIDRATALFGEAGYRGASLREIAARCGISHPGLLHHFGSKEALLAAVLEHRDELDAARMAAGDSGADALRRYVDVIATNAQRRGIVELYAVLSAEATAPDHPAHDYFVRRYRRVVANLAEAFERAGASDPAGAARDLVALTDGLQVQWLLGADVDMAEAVRAHLATRLPGQGFAIA